MPSPTKATLKERENLWARGLRECKTCKQVLPLGLFGKYQRGHDGLQVSCKTCINQRNQTYVASTVQRIGRDVYRDRMNAWQRQRRQSNPPTSEHNRKYNLRSAYRITSEEFDLLAKAQHGLCALCGERPSHGTTYRGRNTLSGGLHVDHDHKTNKIRGLLCSNCNRGLGCFKDDEKRLFLAIAYLRKHT